MIKLETALIEEMRGIRKLAIDFRRERFAIWGPNGSGKSGVVDAVEFCLTGKIGRLAGQGTKGISVAEHGPHVDKAKFPDAALVRLKVYFPGLNKSATISRKIASPKNLKIEPPDAEVKMVLDEIADHPEIKLSRRDILRFILIEPSKRSEEIQTLLKLDDLGDMRSSLNSAKNKLVVALRTASEQEIAARNAFLQHLQIATLKKDDILAEVNKRRQLLDLPQLSGLTSDTPIDSAMTGAGESNAFNKVSALNDIKAISHVMMNLSGLAAAEAQAIAAGLQKLYSDESLLFAFQRRSFLEKGLEFVDGPECPLCDRSWESESLLRTYLKGKLNKSNEAKVIQDSLIENGGAVAAGVVRILAAIGLAEKLALTLGVTELVQTLGSWKSDLSHLKERTASIDGLLTLKDRVQSNWPRMPAPVESGIGELQSKVESKPDQSAIVDAQTFLRTAQVRLSDLREKQRAAKAAEIAAETAKLTYETYCSVLEAALNALYQDVEEDFSTYYRAINEDDESKFTAKLTPSEGQLSLAVNFYERGLYPPAAYHSEGHQDGMGVCLYLALMKRLLGDHFTLALLDDVVMSVDADHRRQFCKLLMTHFPNTQFIITTHDRVWAEQMKNAKLVTAKTSMAFHGWSIDTGPLVASNDDVWSEIAEALKVNKIGVAATLLRQHLEYMSRYLADVLGASVRFRSSNDYELGDLLPQVVSQLKDLCGKAAQAAHSWKQIAAQDAALKIKEDLSKASADSGMEQWAVNKMIHYNEWASLGRKDFEPVVAAFRKLLEAFRCQNCEDWLHVSPRNQPEALRCNCGSNQLNLKAKQK